MTGPWIAAFVVLWVVVLAESFLLLGVFRRVWAGLEDARFRLDAIRFGVTFGGAAPGTLVPRFEVYDRVGHPVPSESLFGEPSVVVFLDHDCEPCIDLAAELSASDRDGIGVPLIVITDEYWGRVEPAFRDEVRVFSQRARAASQAFQSSATPQGFAVATGGTVVAHAIVNRLDDVRRLAREHERGGEPMASPAMSPAATS
jgi:hypothetical protein